MCQYTPEPGRDEHVPPEQLAQELGGIKANLPHPTQQRAGKAHTGRGARNPVDSRAEVAAPWDRQVPRHGGQREGTALSLQCRE